MSESWNGKCKRLPRSCLGNADNIPPGANNGPTLCLQNNIIHKIGMHIIRDAPDIRYPAGYWILLARYGMRPDTGYQYPVLKIAGYPANWKI
jgi:hypothetical protein